MKDKRSLHLKVQELCDCFATAAPLREMSVLDKEQDKEEAALKWLALAILYGIDSHAKKISISTTKDGEVKVLAKYRKSELPAPGADIGNKIIESVKEIAHFEKEKGKIPLAVGIRDSSIEIGLKLDKEGDSDIVSLKFPE